MAIVRWLRPSPPLVEVLPAVDQDPAPAGITMTAGIHIQTIEEAINARSLRADDAADLVRMDDDGGWQMALQPALTDGSADKQDQRLL